MSISVGAKDTEIEKIIKSYRIKRAGFMLLAILAGFQLGRDIGEKKGEERVRRKTVNDVIILLDNEFWKRENNLRFNAEITPEEEIMEASYLGGIQYARDFLAGQYGLPFAYQSDTAKVDDCPRIDINR